MENKIVKPWGMEDILHADNRYIVKKLIINKGCKLSLQYHSFKIETLYLLKGKCRLTLLIPPFTDDIKKLVREKEPIYLTPNEHITIHPNWVHRIEAIEDTDILETSTVELWDIERLDDDYGRVKENMP